MEFKRVNKEIGEKQLPQAGTESEGKMWGHLVIIASSSFEVALSTD